MKRISVRMGWLAILWLTMAGRGYGGDVVASNYLSVGYGYTSSGWRTNETASVNTPTTVPNPSTYTEFTVGDFRFRLCAQTTGYGSAGPSFLNRVIGNSGLLAFESTYIPNTQPSAFTITATYAGTNPAYANYLHLDIDRISIYGQGGTTNECWWEETTVGHTNRSDSVWLPSGTYYLGSQYTNVLWNPPDFAVQDAFSVTRTFCLPKNSQCVEGFELVCSAWMEKRTTPREMLVPIAESSRFSIGYGWNGGWKTNETAAANIPATAPSSGSSFSMGDFQIKVSAAATQYGSQGPKFDNRVLASSGSSSGYSLNAAFSVAAVYAGLLAKANTGFRLNIDRISIYAGGTTNAVWIETTPGNAATSSPVAILTGDPLFGMSIDSVHYYAQLSWNPADVMLEGATNMTRTFTLPAPNPSFVVDGFEIVGSVELLGPPQIPGVLVQLQ